MTTASSVADARLVPTSSQTVGPFVEIGCKYLETDRVAAPKPGTLDVAVRGRVLDGDGELVPDYMLEIWQTMASAPAAFARVMPLADGSFAFHTAYTRSHGGDSAPHLAMLVFMRGLLKPLHTRMYFPDDARNGTDPALTLVPPDRRATLVAVRESQAAASLALEWNIVLQGTDETVFFEW
jgi:protocatechuate 3,4-dioxygenase, alpha subunit